MNNKYIVLYIISTLERCGPVNMLYNIIKHLDRDKFEPHILTLSKEPNNSRIRDFTEMRVNLHSLEMSRLDLELRGKEYFVSCVNRIAPHIIHTHGIRADVYAVKYLKKYKHCNTIHNYPYLDYIMAYGKLKGKLMSYIHIKTFRKIEYPISCSFSIADKLKRNHSLITQTIQNGIDNGIFFPINLEQKEKLRSELGLPIDKRIFVYAGILAKRKDPLTVLEAFKKANIYRDSILLILGDGPLKESCERYASDSVVFKGFVNNPLDYLSASDVFVSASLAEGLPIAVLEAMGVGLPVLLSDIEPHGEIIKNTDAGELFQVGNIERLSELLIYYSKIDLISKSKIAADIISKKYNARLMSEEYMEVYNNLINNVRL